MTDKLEKHPNIPGQSAIQHQQPMGRNYGTGANRVSVVRDCSCLSACCIIPVVSPVYETNLFVSNFLFRFS